MIAASALATDVNPPIPVTVPLLAGQPVKGQITSFDDEAVHLIAGDSTLDLKWTEVKPQAVLSLHERLLAKSNSAEQWMQAGVTLLKVPGGRGLAERPFARALRLDPSLKSKIDAARRNVTTSKPSGDSDDAAAAGVTWGRQNEDERAQTVAKLKQRADEMTTKSAMKLTLYETKYFLFYTDLTRTEAMRWVEVLDRMYARLAEMFGVPKDENIWFGKAVIFVFFKRDDFKKFEKEVFHIEKDAGGRCHQVGNGSVFITFFRSDPPEGFARTLTHESTHGFLFRYRARARIPSWANEGLAEVMEFELVPSAGLKQTADAEAKVELRDFNRLKDFFTKDQIDFVQYPIARTLTEYMIRQNKRGYVDFINGIKDGLKTEESLKQHYGTSFQELIAAYCQSMGVPVQRLE
jgi:hypothetical protein